MTKEKIKYVLDNEDNIAEEIDEKSEELKELNIDLSDDFSAENIKGFYDECNKYFPEIFEKYNLDFEAFKVFVAIYEENKTFREQVLGIDEANQLLKDVIDIYGDEAYDKLGCNSRDFEISDIEGILSGSDIQRYEEFYKKLVSSECEKAYTLEEFSNILLSIKPEYINQDLLKVFLKNPDKPILDSDIRTFIDNAPSKIANGTSIKTLVSRTDRIDDLSILSQIPPELYDQDFAKSLLEKNRQTASIFALIPEQIKNKELWELAISKNRQIIYSLPEQKIDESMTDDEYSEWCKGLVLDVIKNNPDDITEIFSHLQDYQKSTDVCVEGAKLLNEEGYRVQDFLESVPEKSRNREIYELLLQKSNTIISLIPNENFEEGLSQEEYAEWVDNIITRKIAQLKTMNGLYIPREKMTERVWNSLIDKSKELNIEKNDKSEFGLQSVPVQNITIEMCERAIKDISKFQINYMPSIDRKIDTIFSDTEREEYKKWIARFSENEKQEYRKWYEGKVIEILKEVDGGNIFTERFEADRNSRMCIPTEAITVNIIDAYLQKRGPTGIEQIPFPSELTNYNEQYEDIILSAISMLEEKNYLDSTGPGQALIESWDILDKIPEEYRTEKVILEAVKKHPKYLDYADIESENFEELLNIGYRNKLKSIGRTTLSPKEIELMKKFAKNNSSLFSTLNLDILSPDIVSIIGENSIERISRYEGLQASILEVAKTKETLLVFGVALENLSQNSLFPEPLIEQIIQSIRTEVSNKYNSKTEKYEVPNDHFIRIAADRIEDTSKPLTEEEKTIISYLVLNPKEASKIKNYDQILNFVVNKNTELDDTINSKNITLVDAKNVYLERIVGIDYETTMDLIKKYGNDSEQLLAKYEGKELESYKEKAEKEALEIITKLKSLISENDLEKIREAYQEAIEKEDKTNSFERYKQLAILDSSLRRAYGRDITQTLSDHSKENNIETIEHIEDGREYVVRKLTGPFDRMVSLMNAYRKSDAEGDMYDKWNTSKMAGNHALCYSFINESNPGTAMIEDRKGIIISISNFDSEAVTATAPYDLSSDSRENTTVTYRPQKFYMASNLPDQTRARYSEVDIEIQDVSKGVSEYRKIQPTSIICFEEIDEDSINAAIELSKKLGRNIPIELIDRRELASQTREEINGLLEQFKNGESIQPELIEQIITKFNNVRNAHMDSNLSNELLGQEGMFNKKHLNEMLSEAIDSIKERMEEGQVEEGIKAIEQIKHYVKTEREKNVLMPTQFEKQMMSGIDLDIDYRLDELQKSYSQKEIIADSRNESFDVLSNNEDLISPTFEIVCGKRTNMPEQLSFTEFKDYVDSLEVGEIIKEVHEKGYYSENKSYSEEHVARVAMFSNAIANIEGADDKTKILLGEAVKYYSCGRQLDMAKENHQEYSAKIAAKELKDRYSEADVGIIQAAIELQNLNDSSLTSEENQKLRQEKLTELCDKYNLSLNESGRIETIATCISDAVTLDTTRFANKAYPPPGEAFYYDDLKTDAAKRLVKASYCMQDKLSEEHLEKMERVAHIDFKSEKDTIIKEFFTKTLEFGFEKKIFDESIIDSPIVQEEYFRHKYKEFEDPIEIGKKLEDAQSETNLKNPRYSEQEIGKATINVSTASKDKARDRANRDKRQIREAKVNFRDGP